MLCLRNRYKVKVDGEALLSVNTPHFCRGCALKARLQTVFGFGFQAGTNFLFMEGRFWAEGVESQVLIQRINKREIAENAMESACRSGAGRLNNSPER
jgi:hypothetical protein